MPGLVLVGASALGEFILAEPAVVGFPIRFSSFQLFFDIAIPPGWRIR